MTEKCTQNPNIGYVRWCISFVRWRMEASIRLIMHHTDPLNHPYTFINVIVHLEEVFCLLDLNKVFPSQEKLVYSYQSAGAFEPGAPLSAPLASNLRWISAANRCTPSPLCHCIQRMLFGSCCRRHPLPRLRRRLVQVAHLL